MLEYPLLLVFPVAMVFAAAMDLMTMTIPNRISLALIASFLLLAPFSSLGLQHILVNHIVVGIAVLAIGIAMFSAGLMGGGDAKLIAAGALWIGYDKLLEYVLTISVAGGVLALVVLFYRRAVPTAAIVRPDWAIRLHQQGTGIPYGIAIAAAALMTFPTTRLYLGFMT